MNNIQGCENVFKEDTPSQNDKCKTQDISEILKYKKKTTCSITYTLEQIQILLFDIYIIWKVLRQWKLIEHEPCI